VVSRNDDGNEPAIFHLGVDETERTINDATSSTSSILCRKVGHSTASDYPREYRSFDTDDLWCWRTLLTLKEIDSFLN
jgi:hypothetical protein